MSLCPCCSEKEFDSCCGPYLEGIAQAPTAEALMRSRYTAHVLRKYPYLLSSCHSDTRPEDEEFEGDTDIRWTGMEILRTERGGVDDSEGIVEFIASYQVKGKPGRVHEIGSFVREDGQWFYVEGDIVPQAPVRSTKIGRNEPCPCNSGKKYKKCCGKG